MTSHTSTNDVTEGPHIATSAGPLILPPLFLAAREGDLTEVERLLKEEHVDINEKDVLLGKTALHYAALYGHVEIITVLLAEGALINAGDITDKTPLHYAAPLANPEVMLTLIKAGADVHARDDLGRTPLVETALTASTNAQLVAMEMLLNSGADIEARDVGNNTALYASVVAGYIDAVRLLLGRGASVSTRVAGGENVIDLALRTKNTELIELLQGK